MSDHPRPGPRPSPHGKKPKPSGVQIPNWLFYFVVLFVLGLWGAGLVMSFVSKTFEMPESLNAAVPVVLVGLFGSKAVSDRRGGDDDDE